MTVCRYHAVTPDNEIGLRNVHNKLEAYIVSRPVSKPPNAITIIVQTMHHVVRISADYLNVPSTN